ncbi:tRNA threonylcarbamoyladenosine biosynthesis protein [Bacillus safensis FO-36b] [Bacillus safensis subsp. safensis]
MAVQLIGSSTVVSCIGETPVILRPGGITKEALEEVVGTVSVDPGLTKKDEAPVSPGMKYTHYAPEKHDVYLSWK